MPVIPGGRRRKPVLPEAGTGSAAARTPPAFCQFKELFWAENAPVAATASSNAAQIVLLVRAMSAAIGRISVLPSKTTPRAMPLGEETA